VVWRGSVNAAASAGAPSCSSAAPSTHPTAFLSLSGLPCCTRDRRLTLLRALQLADLWADAANQGERQQQKFLVQFHPPGAPAAPEDAEDPWKEGLQDQVSAGWPYIMPL
jgi:hypothetical protein